MAVHVGSDSGVAHFGGPRVAGYSEQRTLRKLCTHVHFDVYMFVIGSCVLSSVPSLPVVLESTEVAFSHARILFLFLQSTWVRRRPPLVTSSALRWRSR